MICAQTHWHQFTLGKHFFFSYGDARAKKPASVATGKPRERSSSEGLGLGKEVQATPQKGFLPCKHNEAFSKSFAFVHPILCQPWHSSLTTEIKL